MRVLIVGCGYVGLPVGTELARQGHEVFGLRRTPGTDGELQAAGIRPVVGDITQPADLARLRGPFDWVVNCVASSGGGAADYQRVYLQGTRNLVEWLAATPLQRIVYTSSTGVYGQDDGSLVEESSPVEPTAETARILVRTEEVLLAAAKQRKLPAVILRLAGIYGPGRGYWLKRFLAGEARLEGGGERILNMIHRDDAVGSILAALERGPAGQIYNAVDDEPVRQIDFFRWLADVLGKPMPLSEPEPGAGARKRGVTNKRVSNSRLKAELGCHFKYPTFREGYAAEIVRLGGALGRE